MPRRVNHALRACTGYAAWALLAPILATVARGTVRHGASAFSYAVHSCRGAPATCRRCWRESRSPCSAQATQLPFCRIARSASVRMAFVAPQRLLKFDRVRLQLLQLPSDACMVCCSRLQMCCRRVGGPNSGTRAQLCRGLASWLRCSRRRRCCSRASRACFVRAQCSGAAWFTPARAGAYVCCNERPEVRKTA